MTSASTGLAKHRRGPSCGIVARGSSLTYGRETLLPAERLCMMVHPPNRSVSVPALLSARAAISATASVPFGALHGVAPEPAPASAAVATSAWCIRQLQL